MKEKNSYLLSLELVGKNNKLILNTPHLTSVKKMALKKENGI